MPDYSMPPDERPDNLAELARLTAIELRKRGIWAEVELRKRGIWAEVVDGNIETLRFGTKNPKGASMTWGVHSLYASDFDNLGPIGCADVIQAEEARKAQEWAGDT